MSFEHGAFDKFADDMSYHDVALLDAGCVVGRHVEQQSAVVFHLAACGACHRDDFDAHLLARFVGFEDIAAVSAGRYAYQYVAFLSCATEQACEDMLIAVVVAHGGEVRGVAVERFSVEGRTVEIEAAAQLCCEVLRVGGAASVAAEMYLASVAQRFFNDFRRHVYGVHQMRVRQHSLLHCDTLFNGFFYSIHIDCYNLGYCSHGPGFEPFWGELISFTLAAEGLAQCVTYGVSAQQLNGMRRQALEQLLKERTERKPVSFSAVSYPPVQTRSAKRPKYCRARFTNGNIPDAFLDCELIYVPMTLSNQALESLMDRGFAVAVEIPRGMFGIEDKLYRRLQEIKALGITEVLASNLGAVELARALDMDIHGGFGLNITNTAAIEQAQRWGLMDVEVSFELTLAQIAALGGKLPIGIIAGGRLPLMLTRNHPADNAKGTQREPFLQDRKGMRFPLQRYGSCTEVLNSVPLTLSDRQQEMAGIDFTVLRFSVENSVEMGEILTVFNRKLPLKPPITRGLYYRGVE